MARIWLTRPVPRPDATVRLLCLPYAGASASVFHSWARWLPREIEVLAVQLPGRGPFVGLPAQRCMDTMSEELGGAVVDVLDKPLVIFGHSMGALLGFELARALRRSYGLSPLLLFASGFPAPHRPRTAPVIHKLPRPLLWEEIARLGGTPAEILADEELKALVEPALRADLAAVETYQYRHETPLDCPIAAFRGLDDPNTSLDDIEAWSHHTEAGFSSSVFAGDHFFITSGRMRVLAAMRHELRRRCGMTFVDDLTEALR